MTFIIDFDDASFPESTREAFTVFELPIGWISSCDAYGRIGLNHFDVVSLPLDEALVHYRRDATIGVDPVMTQEQTICSFTINDEESSR